MKGRWASVVCVAVLGGALAACGKPASAPAPKPAPAPAALQVPAGFQHDPTFEAAGYYLPTAPIQVGNFKLTNISLGAESDFSQWEKGERAGLFGPVFVNFDDLSSPVVTDETGAEGHAKRLRLLPASYRLYPGEVSFQTSDPALGLVIFSGAFDQAALAAAKKAPAGSDAPVLHGTLVIGGKTLNDVAFTYFAGD